MSEIDAMQTKKTQVMDAITPICKAFGITDFDYIIATCRATQNKRYVNWLFKQ
jgi:hypothetical protein